MDMIVRGTKKVGHTIRRWWILVVILLLVGGFFLYRKFTTPLPKVTTYTVTKETLKDILGLSGEIAADEKVDLHFQSGGRLTWVGVKEGDTVKKYDTIASLDQRQLQKTIEKYLNTYDKQRRTFDQSQDDNEGPILDLSPDVRAEARRSLEKAQFDLNNSVLDVELQAIAKEYSSLYSPIDGIVTHVGAPKAGMNVAVTDTYQIVNPDSLFFSIAVDQTDVVHLSEGMQGMITFDAYPDNQVTGTVTSIGFTPKAGETGTVYEARMTFTPDPQMIYRLGMTGDVDFITDEIPSTVAIPLDYAFDENDKTYVNKQVNGKKEKVAIEIGKEYGGDVQILNGLQEGDIIYEVSE